MVRDGSLDGGFSCVLVVVNDGVGYLFYFHPLSIVHRPWSMVVVGGWLLGSSICGWCPSIGRVKRRGSFSYWDFSSFQ